jgi:hypothetical protein
MTPKEKAEILVAKFIKHSRAEKEIKPIQSAKQCALIAVDEILNNSIDYNAYDGVSENDIWSDNEYWQKVKQEIENL